MSSLLQNDLLLRAARGEKTERTPVWLMRQAGRILPEYRAIRESLSGFKELVTTPHLAAEVTIQPVDILDVDAAIIFSDILVIPEAMGLDYEMIEKTGPYFPQTIQTKSDIDKLRTDGIPDALQYVTDAIAIAKKQLNGRVPLIGFCGAPFTILCYMVEGKGSKTFSKAKKLLYTEPALAHALLQKITDASVAYLKAQVNAGADLVQIFDSWAAVLSPQQYSEFSLRYMAQMCEALHTLVPVTVFGKGATHAIAEMTQMPCNTIGLDWTTEVKSVIQLVDNQKTLQGNLDPCALYGSLEQVKAETEKMLDSFIGHRHIANLGHGVYPDTEVEQVKCFIQTVKSYTRSK
jgi:uroporphyrinogen decarboxylase